MLSPFAASPAFAAADCQKLSASLDGAENVRNIAYCLSGGDRTALLDSGIFPLSDRIVMPPGGRILGAPGVRKTTVLSPAPIVNEIWGYAARRRYADASVLEIGDNGVARDFRVTGNGQLRDDAGTSVIAFTGSGARVSNVEIFDLDPRTGGQPRNALGAKVAGVFYAGDAASGDNIADKVLVHDVKLGVVFRAGLSQPRANVFSNGEITRVACDGATFAGYGELLGSFVHEAGYDCGQRPTPVPGAAVYSLNNRAGARVEGNHFTEICGNGLDIEGGENFVLRDNGIDQTGAPLRGQFAYCVGGSPASLVDTSRSRVENNRFRAENTPPLGTLLDLFPDQAEKLTAALAPLPDRARQTIAFRLLRVSGNSAGNIVSGNTMTAACPGGGCEGIGIYVGPGAGGDGAAPNRFTNNSTKGSDTGSLRCGADIFGAGAVCGINQTSGGCNSDDHTRVAGKSRTGGNDMCAGK